jgi:hypothetical protein
VSDTIRSLSETEIDAIAGGRHGRDNSQSLVVMPDPGFAIDTTGPRDGASSYSFGVTQTATF